ncbi:MAG TPA: sulfite exporter TauE/SafE family protein [Gemmatimonadaceae bacterium]|nr:sulfite exporter TauE/SafE family protein [Gemmatimonadaceae bacterium]
MILIFLAIGLVAGVLAGIFGIGGGILVVPALVFFAKMTQRTAIGTSLGALLLPVGALGVYSYWRSGDVDVRAAAWVALGMFVGAYGGAVAAHALSESSLKRAFAVLLVLVAGRLWMTS